MFRLIKRLLADYKETVGNCSWCKWEDMCYSEMFEEPQAPDYWCQYTRKWYLLWRPE